MMNALALPPVCDRAAARALHPDINEAVGSSQLLIDASKVERIGQAMLQVLVSAARSEAGITIASPSKAVMEALRLAGLETHLSEDISHEPIAEQIA